MRVQAPYGWLILGLLALGIFAGILWLTDGGEPDPSPAPGTSAESSTSPPAPRQVEAEPTTLPEAPEQALAETPEAVLEAGPEAASPALVERIARLNGFPPGTRFLPPIDEVNPLSYQINLPTGTIDDDLQRLATTFEMYRDTYNRMPAGSNAEILAAMTGINPRGLRFLDSDLPMLDANGLRDRWGTPFFFHAVNAAQLEIRSGGPDGELWTDDDVVYPPPPVDEE